MLKLGVAGVLLFLSAPPADLFVDVTQSLGIRFNAVATHTSKKYLLETMGRASPSLITTTMAVWTYISSTAHRSPTPPHPAPFQPKPMPLPPTAFTIRKPMALLKM